MMSKFMKGLVAAPFTPMQSDGSLNLSIIPPYYEMLKANGVIGAFICGSTGEGVSLTVSEKKQVAEAWAKVGKQDADFKIILLVGGTSYNECIELAVHAQKIGVDAIAVMAPFYFKPPSVKQLATFCIAVGKAVDIPMYYYHIPVLTGVGFPMIDLLKELDGKLKNFAGIKYTHEDFMDYLSCLRFEGGKYDILWGRDENMLAALSLGATGAVGSTYNYAAPLYQAIIQAFNQNNLPLARELQQKAIDMIRLLGKYGGIATGKAFMKAIGIDCGEFRLPIFNMTSQTDYDNFNKDLEQLNFRQFCSKIEAHVAH